MPETHPFMSYAFRPFFLLNGLFAIAVIAIWMMALHGSGLASLPATMPYWHGHEMVVGFGMAAMAALSSAEKNSSFPITVKYSILW